MNTVFNFNSGANDSSPVPQPAFQRNWVGLFERIAHYVPSAQFFREDGIAYGITNWRISTFNAAIFEDQRQITPSNIDRAIDILAATGVPTSLQFSYHSASPEFTATLTARNCWEAFNDPVMFRTGPLQLTREALGDAYIYPVLTYQDERVYCDVVGEGFSMAAHGEPFIETMLAMDESYSVIAVLHGEPVGAGTAILCNGTAGIYNVTTLSDARRMGVGSAIMQNLHNYALQQGYLGTALASSLMGLPMYRKLGYHMEGYQLAYAQPERRNR